MVLGGYTVANALLHLLFKEMLQSYAQGPDASGFFIL